MNYAPRYFWGDPLDVRFYLCKELSRLKNKKILDIGCNVGIILNSADNSNKKEGFDLNPDTIRIAKTINKDFQHNANFYVKDAFKASLKKSSYDVLILSHVLPGYDYPGTEKQRNVFLNKAFSYLKKGGTLYITSPNKNNSYYRKKPKIRLPELRNTLKKEFSFRIRGWNPFYIHAGHILQYVPGWFAFLEYLMKKSVGLNKCNAFFAKAIKK
ncbi:methyltransferase domain-containing protein [Candidatus Woesearchaeota archaeon]|nr:methyltransferase domain-containing protein [Candidatus Woesearchaeota archaeon]